MAAVTSRDEERPKRSRKNRDERRAEIVASAREVFATSGYTDAGLADVARAASVSKGLVYHYFPEGRPQLYLGVMEQVLGDFLEQLRRAASVPFSPGTRMTHLLGAVFGYFAENETAFRMLFHDPWVSRDETVLAHAAAARAQVASELATVMAGAGTPPNDLLAASTGVLGFTLANVELCLSGQVDAEVAWRVTCEYGAARLEPNTEAVQTRDDG